MRPFLLSGALHLALVLAAVAPYLWRPRGAPPPTPQAQEVQAVERPPSGAPSPAPSARQAKPPREDRKKIAPPPAKAPEPSRPAPEPGDMPGKAARHAGSDCPRFYGGLGIVGEMVGGHYMVVRAEPGYPGSEIGLDTGDVILSPGQDEIQGEVGTTVELVVRKWAGQVERHRVVRDKVCLEEGGE